MSRVRQAAVATSRSRSATIVSLPSKSPTTYDACAARVTREQHCRRPATCGATPRCCPCPTATPRPARRIHAAAERAPLRPPHRRRPISSSRTTQSACPRSASKIAWSPSRWQRASFGFDTVGCSSTGNLANSVAAQAARDGLKACILVPADLEPAKILSTQVYGARWCASPATTTTSTASARRSPTLSLGLRQREPAPLLRRGLKDRRLRNRRATRLAAARQRRRPHGRRFAHPKIRKAFDELDRARPGRRKARALLRRASHRLLANLDSPSKPARTNRAAEAPTPSPARSPSAIPPTALMPSEAIRQAGGWAEDVSDVEIVSSIQELAETEGIFTETAGGVTAGCHRAPLRPRPHLAGRDSPSSASPATA